MEARKLVLLLALTTASAVLSAPDIARADCEASKNSLNKVSKELGQLDVQIRDLRAELARLERRRAQLASQQQTLTLQVQTSCQATSTPGPGTDPCAQILCAPYHVCRTQEGQTACVHMCEDVVCPTDYVCSTLGPPTCIRPDR